MIYYKALLTGEIPLFNFHQSLGSPALASGLPAALYPITYISVILSKLLWGHYFACLDIEAIFHLILGGLGVFTLLKELSLDDRSALFGALTFPLCSFIFYTSNAWIFVSGVACYFPWMIFFSIKLIKNCSKKYFFLLILSRLMLAFIGHMQYFAYTIIFEVLTISLISLTFQARQKIKGLLKPFILYFFSLVSTAILSLPLVLSMWHEMNISFFRSSPFSLNALKDGGCVFNVWLKGLIWPFNLNVLDSASFIGLVTLIFAGISVIKIFSFKSIHPR